MKKIIKQLRKTSFSYFIVSLILISYNLSAKEADASKTVDLPESTPVTSTTDKTTKSNGTSDTTAKADDKKQITAGSIGQDFLKETGQMIGNEAIKSGKQIAAAWYSTYGQDIVNNATNASLNALTHAWKDTKSYSFNDRVHYVDNLTNYPIRITLGTHCPLPDKVKEIKPGEEKEIAVTGLCPVEEITIELKKNGKWTTLTPPGTVKFDKNVVKKGSIFVVLFDGSTPNNLIVIAFTSDSFEPIAGTPDKRLQIGKSNYEAFK